MIAVKRYRTRAALPWKTRGGLAFTSPAGATCTPIPGEPGVFWIAPATFAPGTIERHDATYYGLRVSTADVEELPA